MKKMNFYFNRLTVLAMFMLAMVANQQASAQCAAVNYTVNSACLPTAAAVQLLGADIEVKLDNGTWVKTNNALLTNAYIGRTIEYRVTPALPAGSAMCWSYITIEDKVGPTITKPIDANLVCSDANAAALLPTVSSGTGTGTPTGLADCSHTGTTGIITYYTDEVTASGCATKTVRRTWFAKDKWGNVTQATGVQIINVTANFDNVALSSPATVAPNITSNPKIGLTASVEFDCAATSTTTDGPFVLPAGTTAIYLLKSGALCGLSATFTDGPMTQICSGTRKFTRTWKVVDLCALVLTGPNAATMTQEFTQLITLKDNKTPAVSVSYDTWTLNNQDACYGPMVMPTGPQLKSATKTSETITFAAIDLTTATGATDAKAGSLTIRPRSSASMCGAAGSIELTLTNTDDCSATGLTVSVLDNRFEFVSGKIKNKEVIMGSTSFKVRVTDGCGNAREFTINVVIEDNLAPTATCDDVEMFINGQTTGVLTAASINRNSYDNCGVVRVFIRKTTKDAAGNDITSVNNSANCWVSAVEYDCTNLGDNKVDVLYVDAAGNYMLCCVKNVIKSKGNLACAIGTDIPRTCANDLSNLASIFDNATAAQKPSFTWDGCGTPTATTGAIVTDLAPDCARASAYARYSRPVTYTIDGQTKVCTARIVVSQVRGFRLKRLANESPTCSGATSTLQQDSLAIVNSMSLWHSFKTSANLEQYPDQSNRTCSGPVLEAEEWTYSNAQFCKVIVRTFTIKDICAFSTNRSSDDYFFRKGTLTAAQTGTDTLESIAVDGGHLIRFTRMITIRDNVAPVATTSAVASFCDGTAGDEDNAVDCDFSKTVTLSATDGCGDNRAYTNLFFTWTVTGAASFSGQGPTITFTNRPLGTYTINYTVADLCGNLLIAQPLSFTVTDCKAPEIRVHNKVLALGGVTGGPLTGMVTLHYDDIKNYILDNCDGPMTDKPGQIQLERGTDTLGVATPLDPAPRSAASTMSIMYTCSDLASAVERGKYVASRDHKVRVWAKDAAGNWNFALSTITVQDNDGICTPRATVQGAIANAAGTAVDGVDVTARVAGTTVAAGASLTNGAYSLSIPTRGTNVQVTAAKASETDAREGVSTADIAAISRHILGSQNLASAYSIIAADVDKNGSVEAADMLQIRRFVLFISPALPAGSFRFVDKAYSFRNATEPLGEDFPEVINIANIQGNAAANFVAVKLGDVNNNYRHVSVRGSRNLTLTANDMEVIAGNEYTVNVNAANFDATAFQGTFSFNGLTVKSIQAGNLSNMSDANFGQFKNAVTASWNGKAATTADVVAITFVANKSGKLSDMMSFGSAMTAAEAVAANGENMNVNLKFNSGKVSGAEFALYQNSPNPVATTTKVGFNLPKDGAARFTVFNAEGKVLYATNNDYKAGYNEVVLNKSQLAAGVLYYRLETADHSATKKMIIIE